MLHTDTKFNIEFTANGRLMHLEDWSEKVANVLAQNDNLTLSPAHWEVIRTMREFYQRYNTTPIKKLFKRTLVEKLGADKATDDYLDGLFPHGFMSQCSKLAGLPEPHLDVEIEHRYAPPRSVQSATTVTHFQHQFKFNGKVYKVYEKGNLVELDTWNEELAAFMAQKEGITLTDEHWAVLNYLRKFYFEYGITPMVRILMKFAREERSLKKCSREYLYSLFPKGPSRQGSRIAGLPEPQGCIDG